MAPGGVVEAAKVVVAIDFGTTFSGFSYALMHLAEQDRSNFINQIEGFERWPSIDKVGAKPYCKTQTSLLYVERQCETGEFELKAWGWTAFHEHLKLLQKKSPTGDQLNCKNFHFITNFKLALAGSNEADDATYKLPEGFTVQRVVADYLQKLSILIEEELRKKYGEHIKKKDVQWCLTVPAIWDNAAKEQMKRCAEIAGLVAGPLNGGGGGSVHPVIVVLEPEAAAVYCLDYIRKNCLTDLPRLSKILVVDAGGGTVDLTFHAQVDTVGDSGNFDYRLKEISGSSGALCGATFVDEAFYKFLSRKISCFDKFIKEHPSATVKIREIWENPKVNFDGSSESYPIWLPNQLSKYWEAYDRAHGTLDSAVESTYDELTITSDEMKDIFDSVVQPILELVEGQLKQIDEEDAKSVTIMVVGGFSGSPYLKNRIREEFSDTVHSVVTPVHPGRAVLTGAVVYGSIGREVIVSRVSRQTYGVAYCRDFLPTDPESKLVRADDGRPKCKDAFHVYVRKGADIPVNYCQKFEYEASNWGLGADESNDHMQLDVYTSDDIDPAFVTDPGTVKECTYAFPIPSRESRKGMTEPPRIEVSMYFGRATIEVFAEALNFTSEKAILPTLTFSSSEARRPRQRRNVDCEEDEVEHVRTRLNVEDEDEADVETVTTSGTGGADIPSDRRVIKHWKANPRYQRMMSINSATELKQYVDGLRDSLREDLEYAFSHLMRKLHTVSDQNKNIMHQNKSLADQVQSLEAFTIAEKRSSVPRFAYPDVRRRSSSRRRYKLKEILVKMAQEKISLRFLCEAHCRDRSVLHEVEGQEGLDVKTWKDWVKVLVPCVVWSIKIVFMTAIVTSKAAQFCAVMPISIPFSWYESVGNTLPSVNLSDSTSQAIVDLYALIDPSEDQIGKLDEISDQAARRNSRKHLCELLKSLTPEEFERKIGLTKVALKDSQGRYNDVVWICKPCLQDYLKAHTAEILD